jgi:hypothetical protein
MSGATEMTNDAEQGSACCPQHSMPHPDGIGAARRAADRGRPGADHSRVVQALDRAREAAALLRHVSALKASREMLARTCRSVQK